MEEKTYQKRSGTTNKGLDYEILGVANLAINLMTNEKIKDFHISSNHPDFGAFDDIVVETEQENYAEIHAIQLKHSKGTLSLEQLKAKSGNFSIKKYFESAQGIKIAKTKFILYTNLHFDFKKNTKFCLEGEDFLITVAKVATNETFTLSEKTDYCYQFSVVKDESFIDSVKVSVYEKFFASFFLYTDQENSHNLKLRVSEKFKSCFCGNDIECDQYVRFLSEWSSQEGTIEKLDKSWLTRAMALKVFASRMKPLSFDSNVNTEGTKITRRNILRETIDTFDVSIFSKESYDQVKDLWGDSKNELTDLKIINKLRVKYQLAPSRISDITKLDSLTLSLLLWLMGKAPLILTQDASVNKALELCVGEKFILLGDDSVNPFSENISVFKTLSDLKAKTSHFEKLIQNFTCSLQGKRDLSVANLVRDKEDILINLKTDDLLEMVQGRCLIGEAKESLVEPYIDRCLLKSATDFKILEYLSKDTAVILDCVSHKLDLKKTLTNHMLINVSDFLKAEERPNIEHNVEKFSNSSKIYISEQRCEYSEFNVICNRVKNTEHFHQFRVKYDGCLEWIRSRGDVSDIEKYKLSEYYYIKETDLDCPDFKNSINLLASDPGMGKSELMNSFKIKSFNDHFTVILEPKDVYSFLKNSGDNHAEALFKFLIDEKYHMLSDRDKAIFGIFLKRSKIVFVWDALDELSDDHRDTVSDIVVELSKKFHQWVTSRRHLQGTLQQKFNIVALNLNKFDQQEQTHYIQHRLADGGKTEPIETILDKISTSFALVEHKDILGVPLQIFMLTELLRQDKEKYSSLLNNFFILTDLYNYFIEEKINIHFREKLQIDLNTASTEKLVRNQKRQILEMYTKAALRLLFADEILSDMAVHGADSFEEICESQQNIGLVTEIKDNIPHFLHNSFAEYLAARYLSNQPHRKDVLMQVMFDPKYTNVRFFFDLFLARDSEAHVAILYKNFSFIKNCNSEILTSTDLGGRSLLHLACSWGERYPELTIERNGDSYLIQDEGKFNTSRESNEYLEAIDYLLENCDIYKPDEIYNMTPSEYARKSTCLPAEMRLLMKQNTETEIDHIVNILYYSAHHGYREEFAFCFEIFEQHVATEEKSRRKSKTLRRTLANIRKKLGNTLSRIGARMGHHRISEGSRTQCKSFCSPVEIRNNVGMTLLNIASEMGRLEIVEILVKAGVDINLTSKEGCTPLYWASAKGHEAIVEILLEASADSNLFDKDGITPLSVASRKGYERIVEILLQAGADFNLCDKDGKTPLYMASQNEHEIIVEILLRAGADFNLFDKDGRTPLYTASLNEHESIVELLCNAGADVNLSKKNGITPLYIASQEGYRAIVEILLKAGPDVNLSNNNGATPLHIASQLGHERIVGMLLKAGVDMSLTNEKGCDPLYWASAKGHETIVQMLLKAGAEINFPDEDGCTQLYVASQNGQEAVVETLLRAGADTNLSDKDGFTPLYVACENRHETIVELLLKAGADVNMSKKNGVTPLFIASQNGLERIVEILLKAGADVNLSRTDGSTPLSIASQFQHETIVEMLLEGGAEINFLDEDGCTQLYIASQNGQEAIVEILLKAGADVNISKKNGVTPLFIASQNGLETIVKILLKAGADVNLSRIDGSTPLSIASQFGHETIVEMLQRGCKC